MFISGRLGRAEALWVDGEEGKRKKMEKKKQKKRRRRKKRRKVGSGSGRGETEMVNSPVSG